MFTGAGSLIGCCTRAARAGRFARGARCAVCGRGECACLALACSRSASCLGQSFLHGHDAQCDGADCGHGMSGRPDGAAPVRVVGNAECRSEEGPVHRQVNCNQGAERIRRNRMHGSPGSVRAERPYESGLGEQVADSHGANPQDDYVHGEKDAHDRESCATRGHFAFTGVSSRLRNPSCREQQVHRHGCEEREPYDLVEEHAGELYEHFSHDHGGERHVDSHACNLSLVHLRPFVSFDNTVFSGDKAMRSS